MGIPTVDPAHTKDGKKTLIIHGSQHQMILFFHYTAMELTIQVSMIRKSMIQINARRR